MDVFVSRDLDSLISDREQAAVQDWLNAEAAFHVMRDHPDHGVPMLGSAWGTKLNVEGVRQKWENSWEKAFHKRYLWARKDAWGPDQNFLENFIWPWAQNISIGHDAYHCEKFNFTRPFPTQRKNEPNNFVAAVVAENHTLWKTCPPACRPKSHPDWEHC